MDDRRFDAHDMEVSATLGEIRVAIARIEAAIARVAEVQGECCGAERSLATRLQVVEKQATQARAWVAGAVAVGGLCMGFVGWLVSQL